MGVPKHAARPSAGVPAPSLVASSLLVTLVLAALAHFTLELWQLNGDIRDLWERGIGDNPALFWLGTLIVWMLVLLVLSIVGRLWITVGLVIVTTTLLAFAHHAKLALRLEPLYPSDLAVLADPGFLREMVGWSTSLALIGAISVVMVAAVVTGRFAERRLPRVRRRTHPRLALGLLLGRGCAVALLLVGVVHLTEFNRPGNGFRATFEGSGAQWRSWHQSINYVRNGFVAGMLYNTDVPGMAKPADYSAETMRAIADRYAAAAAAINEKRDPEALDDVNVVMVLSETLTDPTQLTSVRVAQDPIPFTHSLMRRTTSGKMLAAKFGGGTANAEFSALTGMSLALFQPQMNTPYQMLVPDYDTFPSLVGYFNHQGHRTVAIHPFRPLMYRRPTVYPTFGFDEVKFDEQMHHQGRLESNGFISDAAAFREVRDHIDETDDPTFVNLVTMQNHYPMAGKYADPIAVTGVEDPERALNAEHYMRGLRHSDDALRELIAAVDRSREKTVVVLYGDHQPGFWPPEVRAADGQRRMRETPFLVYANFGSSPARALPTTSPANFGTHILDTAQAPLPPFLVLLRKLEHHVPAIEHRMAINADDQRVRVDELSPRAHELLHDYRLVQYDLSIGNRYVQDEMFYPEQVAVSAAD